jgi:hypothetical protein
MPSDSSIHELPRQAGAGRWPRPRFSLRWLLVATAFVAVVVSHVNTSLNLRRGQRTIEQQQGELKKLRDELGVFEVEDRTKAHVVFVRQTEDKAWRWRLSLPPQGRYMLKWAIDSVASKDLSSQWEGQQFQTLGLDSTTFTVDLFLRKGADGHWRWFLRNTGRLGTGELTREVPADHPLISPSQPIVGRVECNGSGGLTLSDPKEPLVLFRYQLIPQAEFDAAQAPRHEPDGTFPGIIVWIEPAP